MESLSLASKSQAFEASVCGGGVLYESGSPLQCADTSAGSRGRLRLRATIFAERMSFLPSPTSVIAIRRAHDRSAASADAIPGAAPRARGERSRRRVLSRADERGWQRRGLRGRSGDRRDRSAPPRDPTSWSWSGSRAMRPRRAEIERRSRAPRARRRRRAGCAGANSGASSRASPLEGGRRVFAKHYSRAGATRGATRGSRGSASAPRSASGGR